MPQTISTEREGYFSAAGELIDDMQINEIEMLNPKKYLNVLFFMTILLPFLQKDLPFRTV
jgi:hypothetical protein